ncbi:MAG: ATP-binding cassette domain-containing protein [Victivallales bacterium]|nr:ATP-binding cassette domain-containing protein [Victivallales bacterium]
MTNQPDKAPPPIEVRNLTMAYGERIIQHDLNFDIPKGSVFIVMGGSGCGKSTLLRHLIGLNKPADGTIFREGVDFWNCAPEDQTRIMRNSGILYQSGALWSALTIAENVALPLQQFTDYSPQTIAEICEYKLALVGLAGRGKLYPSELSGGMKKRAGLARAMALDPELLFFDEPSAGLDPLSAQRLDQLILEISNSLHTTIVVITHDLDSIFNIATDSVFLDAETRTMIARGNPRDLRENCPVEKVRTFLRRGK